MKPWLHFTLGDNLFFMSWVPLSAGSVVGACIGLFLLAIIERWVAAMRAVMEAYWARRTNEILAARFVTLDDDKSVSSDNKPHHDNQDVEIESIAHQGPSKNLKTVSGLRRSAPFIPAHDFARGAIYATHAALGYAFMLAVMTFNVGYIIAIVVGFGVGEVMFGRFAALAHHHH